MAKPQNIKEALKGVLTQKELSVLNRSFDKVGELIIIELDESLTPKEKLIGQTIINNLPHVKTVAKKVGHHHGTYRTQKVKIIAGVKRKAAFHKESGCVLKIHPEQTFFSPRLSNERLRVARQVKDGEDVLVMFSGAAPYPRIIAKNAKPSSIVGVELNPHAHKLALENLKLNKIKNTTLYNADARKKTPKLKQKFDRIIMPLPKQADDFLDAALSVARKDTILHVYCFAEESQFDAMANYLKDRCKQEGNQVKILSKTACGQHAPRVFRVCIDLQVL